MLIKKMQITKEYEDGFNSADTRILTTLEDLDRSVNIIQGDWVEDKMEAVIKGIEIGVNMAGYLVSFDKVKEVDCKTKKVRFIK